MKVNHISARTVTVPLAKTMSFATRVVSQRQYTVVRVESDEDHIGYGFSYCGTHAGHLVTETVDSLLKRHVLGQDPRRTEAIWDSMYRDAILLGRRGAVLRGMSAVDIALWDLFGKVAGTPLYKLLGGHRTSVPAYASGGYYADGKGLQELQEEIRRYRATGFRDAKIKVGRLSLHDEVERVAAAREALGPHGRLFLDANNAWDDVAGALEATRAFEPYDIGWLEEPFMPDNVAGHAELARRTRVPIATGEIEQTRWGFKQLLDAGAASILQADAAVCGGVTEFAKVAHLAQSYGIPIAPHWFSDLHVSLVAAVPNGMIVEHFVDNTVLNFRDLLRNPLEPVDGTVAPREQPGTGIEFDEEKLAEYTSEATP